MLPNYTKVTDKKKCETDGCNNFTIAGKCGKCGGFNKSVNAAKQPTKVVNRTRKCATPDCTNNVRTNQYCYKCKAKHDRKLTKCKTPDCVRHCHGEYCCICVNKQNREAGLFRHAKRNLLKLPQQESSEPIPIPISSNAEVEEVTEVSSESTSSTSSDSCSHETATSDTESSSDILELLNDTITIKVNDNNYVENGIMYMTLGVVLESLRCEGYNIYLDQLVKYR